MRYLYWSDECCRIWGLIRCRAFQVDKVCGNAFTQRTAIECGQRFKRPCTRKEISWLSLDSSYLMEQSNGSMEPAIMCFPPGRW